MIEINLTNQNFEEEVLKKEGLILVDFFATWCMPCQMLAPVLSQIAEENKEKVKVCKVNVDEQNELAMKYEILSIPTIKIFKDGKVEKTLVGLRTKSEIEEVINDIIN